jgi:ribosomal protein S18 acetylase RimI-like enzyme
MDQPVPDTMLEPIRYRETLDTADPTRIKALVEAAGVFSEEEAQTAADLASWTLAGSDFYRFIFAERGGELVGYTCYDQIPLSALSFDLYWIAIAPATRASGLAMDLMTRTAAEISRIGGLWIFAETSSRDPYAPARAFYRKAGFEEVARFEDFYAIGDAKIMFRRKL